MLKFRVRDVFRNNWPYFIMLAFVIIITTLALFADKKDKHQSKKTEPAYALDFSDLNAMKERQEKFEKIAKENVSLYLVVVAFNLSIMVLFFGGILLDIVLISDFFRNKRQLVRTLDHEKPNWGILDVFKVALMFYTFAYLFLFFEAKLGKVIPVLKNENFKFIFEATIIDSAGILFVLNCIILIFKQNISAIGLTARNLTKNIIYGITGYIAIIPTLFVTLIITAVIISIFKLRTPVQPIVDMFIKEENAGILFYSTIFAGIFGPIMEEIFFRGFMYNAFKRRTGSFWAMIITAFVFSLLHAYWVGLIPIMILGLLLSYLYEKTGSLVPSITVHILHNMASVAMVFLMKGLNF